jgi:hypothetical protein
MVEIENYIQIIIITIRKYKTRSIITSLTVFIKKRVRIPYAKDIVVT